MRTCPRWLPLLILLARAGRALGGESGAGYAGAPVLQEPTDVAGSEWRPRLRLGFAGVLGGNGMFNGGIQDAGWFSPGMHGVGGLGLSARAGLQWSDLLSTEIEIAGDLGVGEEARASLLLSVTPIGWFSLGAGPALGVNAIHQCAVAFDFFGSPALSGSGSNCGDYSAGYVAAVARIDFLPGGGQQGSLLPEARRSFDLGFEGVVGTALTAVPAVTSADGWGLYLTLGYLFY